MARRRECSARAWRWRGALAAFTALALCALGTRRVDAACGPSRSGQVAAVIAGLFDASAACPDVDANGDGVTSAADVVAAASAPAPTATPEPDTPTALPTVSRTPVSSATATALPASTPTDTVPV